MLGFQKSEREKLKLREVGSWPSCDLLAVKLALNLNGVANESQAMIVEKTATEGGDGGVR